jgi:hypothetical protein
MRTRRTIGIAAVLALAATTQGAAPATASRSTARYPAAGSLAPLRNATRSLVHGTRTAYGCDFAVPTLRLARHEKAVETRQVMVDLGTCTTIWETGTPTQPDDGTSMLTVVAKTTRKSPLQRHGKSTDPVANPAGVGSGYEKGWITDIPGLTVNSVQSNLSWSWNGSCTTGGSGTTDYFWRSGTGWSAPYNNSSTLYPSCSIQRVGSTADFVNNGFCPSPWSVWAYYRDITVTGWYNGTLTGAVTSVSHSYSCLALFDHYALTRVT